MTTCQDLLVNGINKIIHDLVTNPQPAQNPGMDAWAWFSSSTGYQPAEANEYVQDKLGSTTAASIPPSYAPIAKTYPNWSMWSAHMGNTFNNLTSSQPNDPVSQWLTAQWPQDPPTVPDDVINWTKAHMPMPTSSADVQVKTGERSRVGR